MRGTLRLAAVFALLIGINVYVFFFGSGSLKKVSQAAQQASTREDGLSPPGSSASSVGRPAPAVVSAVGGAGTGAAALSAAGSSARPAAVARPKRRGIDGSVRDREGLGAALRRDGVDAPDTDAVIRALSPLMDFKREIHPGQRYLLRLDDAGRLLSLELRASGGGAWIVSRQADGKLVGERRGGQ